MTDLPASEVPGDGWSAWPAPAKLNLFLRVTGRRDDGYHSLQTVFRLLDWGDTIHLRMREDDAIRRHGVSAAGVAEEDDLTVLAAKLLKSESKISLGVDIAVEKSIPVGGGFGGGSSDAASVLVALNRLWRLDWPLSRLAALGLQLGADVPVFVHGENAWAEGVGEHLTPIELPPAWYLLVDPGVHVATGVLFQAPELTRDAPPATIVDFASGAWLGNAFEPLLRCREPAVEAVFEVLSQFGRARLTGTGSGCFVEFAGRESAEAALAVLPRGMHGWIAAGSMRSPLLGALERTKMRNKRSRQ